MKESLDTFANGLVDEKAPPSPSADEREASAGPSLEEELNKIGRMLAGNR